MDRLVALGGGPKLGRRDAEAQGPGSDVRDATIVDRKQGSGLGDALDMHWRADGDREGPSLLVPRGSRRRPGRLGFGQRGPRFVDQIPLRRAIARLLGLA